MTLLFLITNIQSCFLEKSLEGEITLSVVKLSFIDRVKLNITQIRSAFKTKELTNLFIFVSIQGALLPRYDDYVYFYLTDEKYLGINQMTYGIIKVLSFLGTFIGVIIYSQFMKQKSIKDLMVITTILNVVSGTLMTIFLKQIYFGIQPLVYFGTVQLFSDAFSMAFMSMPQLALVAKLIPHSIESSIFAFFTGLVIFCYFFFAKVLGNLINLQFKVTKDSL